MNHLVISKKRNSFLLLVMFGASLLFASFIYKNKVFDSPLRSLNAPQVPSSTAFCGAATATTANIISPIKSGKWTNTTIWPGGVLPTINDQVEVPDSIVLTLVGESRAKSIRIYGTLAAIKGKRRNAGFNLATQGIVVEPNGLLEIGTEADPFMANQKGVITLVGPPVPNPDPTYKGLLVKRNGLLELHGKPRKSWTNIAVTANAGDRDIILKEPVAWESGDVIALTSTGLANKGTKAWEDVDLVTIESVSADGRTIQLVEPLQFKHVGGSVTYTRNEDGKTWNADVYGEVGLLSHYIKIQGQTTLQEEFGGHIMVMKGSTSHVEHVELFKMGQIRQLGRYPFHWHLCEDASRGSYLKNVSIHKSFNRAVTIHGTDYITVDGVFAYDHIGHGMFLENGGERFNTIKNNVVCLTRRPIVEDDQKKPLTPSDNELDQAQNRTPASYWITNPNNNFENNVAAGTEGTGFWFAFPTNGPLNESRILDYYQGNPLPWEEALGRFDGFVAHTCMNGWDVFDQLNDDHSINRNKGWNVEEEQYIENGIFYGNDQAIYSGLGIGGDSWKTVFRNCVFSDNKTITMLASDIVLRNCLFNVDTELGVFEGEREFYRFYDGPGIHEFCHFEGWNRPNARMIQYKEGVGATEKFHASFKGITKGFDEPFVFKFVDFKAKGGPRKAAIGFWDEDGSFLGKAKTTLIRDIAFNRDGSHEYRHPNWENAIRSDFSFASLQLHGYGDPRPNISINRTKLGTADACIYDPENGAEGTHKAGLIVNEGFVYNYYFSQVPTSKGLSMFFTRGETGDQTIVCFKGWGKLQGFSVDKASLVQSLGALEASNGMTYFIDTDGDVYVKIRAIKRRTIVVRFAWAGIGTFTNPTPPCRRNSGSDFQSLLPDGVAPVATFNRPQRTQFLEGVDLGVNIAANDDTDGGQITNVRLYLNGQFIRDEKSAPYQWGAAQANQAFDDKLSNLAPGEYLLQAVATDNEGATTMVSKTITVNRRISIPGEFEAENFNYKSGDVMTESTPGGGRNLGFIKQGNSVQYEVLVRQTDMYKLDVFAANHNGGGIIDVLVDGVNAGSMVIPVNGGWHNYQPYEMLLSLDQGGHSLEFVFSGNSEYLFNIDRMEVLPASVTNVSSKLEIDTLAVFPNPSADGVFKFSVKPEGKWQVYNLEGILIQEGKGDVVKISQELRGIYYLKHRNRSTQITFK